MWNHLVYLYLSYRFNLKYILFNNLYVCQLNQYFSVNAYALKYKTLLQEIVIFNLIINKTMKIITFLLNLEFFYSQWVTVKCFRACNVILFLNNLIIKLIDKECLKERNEKLALMSKKKNHKDKKKKNKKRNADKSKSENEMYTYCKKAIHSENNYWKLHSEKMSKELKKK